MTILKSLKTITHQDHTRLFDIKKLSYLSPHKNVLTLYTTFRFLGNSVKVFVMF